MALRQLLAMLQIFPISDNMNYRIIEIIIIVLMLFSANCGMAQNSNYVSWFLEGGAVKYRTADSEILFD